MNLALAATLVLSLLKLAVAWFTGSVSVLSEAIHSTLDLVSSALTKIVISVSDRPADQDRPYGYGKLENISALFEAALLVVAGLYIIYEGVTHLHLGLPLRGTSWAIAIMLLSTVVNLFVYLQNRSVGRAEESIAIETNAYHFLTDAFTSAALLLGFIVIETTGWHFIDPMAAIGLALYIFWVAILQIRKCIDELSDVALPSDEVRTIEAVLQSHRPDYIDFHDLRTRKVGPRRHVEMHLTVCSELKVKYAHDLCDRIEDEIQARFTESHVSIHIEPCDHHETDCQKVCKRSLRPRALAEEG